MTGGTGTASSLANASLFHFIMRSQLFNTGIIIEEQQVTYSNGRNSEAKTQDTVILPACFPRGPCLKSFMQDIFNKLRDIFRRYKIMGFLCHRSGCTHAAARDNHKSFHPVAGIIFSYSANQPYVSNA